MLVARIIREKFKRSFRSRAGSRTPSASKHRKPFFLAMNTPGGFERMFELAPNTPEEAARALTAFGMDVVGPQPRQAATAARDPICIPDDYRCSTSRPRNAKTPILAAVVLGD